MEENTMAAKKATKSRSARAAERTEVSVAAEPKPASTPPSPIRRPMPWFGWLGLGILVVSEILLILGVHPVAELFTPIMWTSYILFVDGWIWARGHKSFFKDEKLEWPMLALVSFLIWVMFEVFNFSLKSWWSENSPTNLSIREILYAWAYATIITAMLRTRSLFSTFNAFHLAHPWKIRFTPFWLAVSFIVGLAFTFMPVMFDYPTSNLLIPFVWIGFIFLIEPINYRIGAPSVFHDLEEGKVSFLLQLLAAGFLSGLLWESWNGEAVLQKGIIWRYNINELYHIWIAGKDLKIGQMPVLGFLGYPPFIWECYALWELIRWSMHGNTLWKSAKV